MPNSTWIHSGNPQAPSKTAKTLAWIREHREAVTGSLVMLAAASIFGVWVAIHYSGLREAAWKDLFIAQQIGFSGRYAEAGTKLDSIETNYRNTSAWGFAALTKGDLFFRQNKFKEAAEEYAKLAVKGPKNLMPFAYYNLGRAKEAAADLTGAQSQYKNFLTAFPEHFLAPEVHFSLAGVHELSGNQAEAKAAYEKIVLLYPETSWAVMSKEKIMPAQKKEDEARKPAAAKFPDKK